MARGLHLRPHGGTATVLLPAASVSKATLSSNTDNCISMFRQFRSGTVRSPRFFCKFARAQREVDLAPYQEIFSKRMAMAGIRPHHRIALGVSGGPDSMALCVLTAKWKTEGNDAVGRSSGFIDGLVAIVVDHGLRTESREEAELVSRRVSGMGIKCEVVSCDWVDGKPKLGHLQEAAREMRYQKLQNVCSRKQIGALLIAHHADDQAELFILRLSRNSGVLGLACMPFVSQIFSLCMHYSDGTFRNHSTLVVRPLLEFWKEDMYKICQQSNQDCVEDPTNCNQSFARNRIRKYIGDLPSSFFKSELHAVISACRETRTFVDHMCSSLLDRTVTIMSHGYAVLDLENLDPSNVPDICLSKYLALILQFISQRQRPIRGSTSKLLLQYIRTIPCKNSLTAASCYLCPAPGSKGTKAVVCFSVNCSMPEKTHVFYTCSYENQKNHDQFEVEEIIAKGKSFSDHFLPDATEVQFLNLNSGSILSEVKRLNMLSESTYRSILLLQREETNRFNSKAESTSKSESKHEAEMGYASSTALVRPGQICYFRDRFLVLWKHSKVNDECHCGLCVVSHDKVFEVRHMVERDWLHLACLAKCPCVDASESQRSLVGEMGKTIGQTKLSPDFVRLSAQSALLSLKSIPVAARRGLPVIVNSHGLLLSIPTVGFRRCPCLDIFAEFKPRVPLGGGHSTFI